jgi:hypothetical protein
MMSFDSDRRALSNFRGFTTRLARPEQPTHLPSRPSWTCGTCGEEWPCTTARESLMSELAGTRLAMLMWTHLEHYALDQGKGPLSGAFERFIAWTRRPTPRA